MPNYLVPALAVGGGLILIAVALVLGRFARRLPSGATSTWRRIAVECNLQRGHVVPSDARGAYRRIPAGAMTAGDNSFTETFEAVDGNHVSVFAVYRHPAPFPHPCTNRVVAFCRVDFGDPGIWIGGQHPAFPSAPHIGGRSFQVPVDTGTSLEVRTLGEEMTRHHISIVRECFAAFAERGCPYDVVACDGWLIIVGPRPVATEDEEVRTFISRTLELANKLRN